MKIVTVNTNYLTLIKICSVDNYYFRSVKIFIIFNYFEPLTKLFTVNKDISNRQNLLNINDISLTFDKKIKLNLEVYIPMLLLDDYTESSNSEKLKQLQMNDQDVSTS